jgi:uncharacterized metal-binding protein
MLFEGVKMQNEKTGENPFERVVLLPCSGSSNCGQIANNVAVKLTEEGIGKMACLAGIGAHIEKMILSAKSANRLVAIDGCSTACASKLIEHCGIVLTDRVCITDFGIKKVHEFNISPEDIDKVMNSVKILFECSKEIYNE